MMSTTLEIPIEQTKGMKFMGNMQAAVIESANSLQMKTLPIPSLLPGEALIKVSYCGICGSDLHILQGQHSTAKFPVVPGHEFVGELVEICGESPEDLKSGDLVVAQPFFSCGRCDPCSKGRDNICESLRFMGAHVNGAFAQYVKTLTRKVYKLPRDIDRKLAALTEPIAVSVHDVRRSGLSIGQNTLIIGGGPIGLMLAITARNAGARDIVISEINPYRRDIVEKLGFMAVNPLNADFEERVWASSGGRGFDVIFEASGSKPGVAASTKFARNTGVVMVVGMTSEPYPVDLSAVFLKELELRGVRIHAQYSFSGAVDILRAGTLNAEYTKMVTNVYPFERIGEAFELAQSKEDFLKVLVKM
jgi:2-desacetyl-2-hydroxyethyl bacteriochlorophyllide A dehydrogenase